MLSNMVGNMVVVYAYYMNSQTVGENMGTFGRKLVHEVFGLAFGMAFGMAFKMGFGMAFGMGFGMELGLGFGMAFGMAVGLAYYHQ